MLSGDRRKWPTDTTYGPFMTRPPSGLVSSARLGEPRPDGQQSPVSPCHAGPASSSQVIQPSAEGPTFFQAADAQRQPRRSHRYVVLPTRANTVPVQRHAVRIAAGIIDADHGKMHPNAHGCVVARGVRGNARHLTGGVPSAGRRAARISAAAKSSSRRHRPRSPPPFGE